MLWMGGEGGGSHLSTPLLDNGVGSHGHVGDVPHRLQCRDVQAGEDMIPAHTSVGVH